MGSLRRPFIRTNRSIRKHFLNPGGGLHEKNEGGIGMNQFSSETTALSLAESGDVETKFIVAQTYLLGDENQEDYRTAFKLLNDVIAVDPDYMEAYVYLGMCCLWGIGTEENLRKAFHFFVEGEMRASAKCRLFLGSMYNTGCGVSRDQRYAVYEFEMAAQCGDRAAARQLAQMYKEGDGVEKDEEKAKEYEWRGKEEVFDYVLCERKRNNLTSRFIKAASDFGIEEAMYTERHRGGVQNGIVAGSMDGISDWFPPRKRFLFKLRAAELGSAGAHEDLGESFLYGKHSLPVDVPLGIWHLEKACELGDAICMYSMGHLYTYEKCVERDLEKAFA